MPITMKDGVVLILGFCIAEAYGSIAYKAKFIGHMKVAGDSDLVYALSVTHCLAQCNKDADCDAITFYDELKKCRLFKRCTPTRVLLISKRYHFYSKRPPISKAGYIYEARSDSCIRLTDTDVEYKQAARHCERDKAYLSSLNTPELVTMASELLSFKNREEAWASLPSDSEKHSHTKIAKQGKKARRIRLKRDGLVKCRVLRSGRVTETASCQMDKRFGVCQIPTY